MPVKSGIVCAILSPEIENAAHGIIKIINILLGYI
jgi:hypothetical protein